MKNLPINPKLLSDNNTFKFVNVPTMYYGFTDVIYKGHRIAIINGTASALQWTNIKKIDIPIKVVNQLERMVTKLIKKSATK